MRKKKAYSAIPGNQRVRQSIQLRCNHTLMHSKSIPMKVTKAPKFPTSMYIIVIKALKAIALLQCIMSQLLSNYGYLIKAREYLQGSHPQGALAKEIPKDLQTCSSPTAVVMSHFAFLAGFKTPKPYIF